jgi:transcription initiation factor TFIID TATA-box-binding protein
MSTSLPSDGGVSVGAVQEKPDLAGQNVIATDLENAHNPSLAGSVIECQDEAGDRTLLIRIQNIASTANLGVRLDLKKIALKCRNTEFNPRRFGAVIMRLREPRATALIFASGKICVTGVKSTHNATLACKKFHYIIERVGFKPKEYMDFKVQNIVGTADLGFPIRLEGLLYAHSVFCSYEPEVCSFGFFDDVGAKVLHLSIVFFGESFFQV